MYGSTRLGVIRFKSVYGDQSDSNRRSVNKLLVAIHESLPQG
jgi:hypothetical protein